MVREQLPPALFHDGTCSFTGPHVNSKAYSEHFPCRLCLPRRMLTAPLCSSQCCHELRIAAPPRSCQCRRRRLVLATGVVASYRCLTGTLLSVTVDDELCLGLCLSAMLHAVIGLQRLYTAWGEPKALKNWISPDPCAISNPDFAQPVPAAGIICDTLEQPVLTANGANAWLYVKEM